MSSLSEPVRLSCAAILFDSDGVLVDSHDQVELSWSEMAVEFGLDYHLLATELVGLPARETLARHLRADVLDAACAHLDNLEVLYAADTTELAGATDLLKSLPAGRWTIVTSASRRVGVARWLAAGIVPPPVLVSFDDVSAGKPNPEPYLAGAGLLGVDPASCVVFEDSPGGGLAAVRAGCSVIAVGGHRWDVTPFARVVDLRDVVVTVGTAGLLEVTIMEPIPEP